MRFKAVIFDLDGTLINTIEDIANANNRMLQQFSYPLHPLVKYIQWIGNGAAKLVYSSLPSNIANGKGAEEYLQIYKKNYTERLCVKSAPYRGITEVLDFLTTSNIPMAINTNKPDDLASAVVDHYFADWKFTDVVGKSDAVPHKPNPTGALNIASRFKCKPEEIVFIGDSYVDMKTALAANMIPLGVSWGYGNPGPQQGENYKIVDESLEIIDFIKQ